MRDRQEFDCPDCSIALMVRLNGGLCEVLINDQLAPKPANKGASSAPKIVAWSTVGILIVGFFAFLLTGPEKTSNANAADAAKPEEELAEKSSEQPSAVKVEAEGPMAEPVLPLENQPVAATDIPPGPDTEEPVPGDVLIPIPPTEPIEAQPDLAELQRQRERERIAEEERIAIAAVQEKLDLRLAKYKSADSLTLSACFEELSSMSGTSINVTALARPLNATVSLALENCTLNEILDAVTQQAGLDYEVRADGVHVFNQ